MKEKKAQFNIVKSDRTTHGGYHTGTINLNNLSSLLINGEQVKVDLGLIHAKSAVERGIRFTSDEQEVPEGTLYWVIWVAIDRNDQGPYYAGVTVNPMRINHDTRRGWKNLANHVNFMSDALKRRFKLEGLQADSREALKAFLQAHDEAMWVNSPEELKQLLTNPI